MKNKKLKIVVIIILCIALAGVVPFALTFGLNYVHILTKSRMWSNSVPMFISRMVSVVELYKEEYGYYPKELKDIVKKPYSPNHFAIGHIMLQLGFGSMFRIEYKLLDDGESYYFFSRGFDNKEYTEDDLMPEFDWDDWREYYPGYRELVMD